MRSIEGLVAHWRESARETVTAKMHRDSPQSMGVCANLLDAAIYE